MADATLDQLAGGKSVSAGDNTLNLKIDPAHFLPAGAHTFQLVVTDNNGNSSVPVTWTVNVIDARPTVKLTAPGQVELGKPFTLTAAATPVAPHQIASYVWTLTDGAPVRTDPVTTGPGGHGTVITNPADVVRVSPVITGQAAPVGPASGQPGIAEPASSMPSDGGAGSSTAGGGSVISASGGDMHLTSENVFAATSRSSDGTASDGLAEDTPVRSFPPGVAVPPAD